MFGKTKNKAGNEDITEMMPEKQKGPMDKEKKKKIRRRVILGVVAVLAVAQAVLEVLELSAAPVHQLV